MVSPLGSVGSANTESGNALSSPPPSLPLYLSLLQRGNFNIEVDMATFLFYLFLFFFFFFVLRLWELGHQPTTWLWFIHPRCGENGNSETKHFETLCWLRLCRRPESLQSCVTSACILKWERRHYHVSHNSQIRLDTTCSPIPSGLLCILIVQKTWRKHSAKWYATFLVGRISSLIDKIMHRRPS